MTIYPEAFDSDLELPRADDDVSELSADYINSLRDAIIAIERAVGINPQGNKSSLIERIKEKLHFNLTLFYLRIFNSRSCRCVIPRRSIQFMSRCHSQT